MSVIMQAPAYNVIGFIGPAYIYYTNRKDEQFSYIEETKHTTFNPTEVERIPKNLLVANEENGSTNVRVFGQSFFTCTVGDTHMSHLTTIVDTVRLDRVKCRYVIVASEALTVSLDELGKQKKKLKRALFHKWLKKCNPHISFIFCCDDTVH